MCVQLGVTQCMGWGLPNRTFVVFASVRFLRALFLILTIKNIKKIFALSYTRARYFVLNRDLPSVN